MGLKNRAMVFEIDLDVLTGHFSDDLSLPRHFEISLQLAGCGFSHFPRPAGGRHDPIFPDIHEELLEKVCIFDVYDGKGIPEGMKSLGLRFSYRADDRTLTDLEVSQVHNGIVKRIVDKSGAKIRGEEI